MLPAAKIEWYYISSSSTRWGNHSFNTALQFNSTEFFLLFMWSVSPQSALGYLLHLKSGDREPIWLRDSTPLEDPIDNAELHPPSRIQWESVVRWGLGQCYEHGETEHATGILSGWCLFSSLESDIFSDESDANNAKTILKNLGRWTTADGIQLYQKFYWTCARENQRSSLFSSLDFNVDSRSSSFPPPPHPSVWESN